MAENELGVLFLRIGAKFDEFKNALNTVQSETEGAAKKMGGAFDDFKRMAVSALGAISFAVIVKEIYQLGVAFDDVKTKVAVATGDMGSDLKDTTDLIREMFRNTDVSFKDAGDMMIIFRNTMGLTNEQIKEQYGMWETWMDVTGKGTEVLSQTDKVMRVFGLTTVEQTKELMDYAIVIQRLTPIGFDPLMNTLAQAGPLFQALGMNVQESVAFLGMMTAAGLDAESATMALNYAVRTISTPEELKELIRKIQEAPDAFTAAQLAADVFGARGGAKLAAALRDGTVSLDDLISKLDQGRGAFDAAGKVIDESFSEKLGNLKNRLTDIGIGIGAALIGPLTSLVDFIGSTVIGALDLFGKGITAIVDVWNSLPPAIQDTIKVIGGIVLAFEGVKIALTVLKTLMVGHPLFLMATLLAGTIMAIGALVDAFGSVEEKLERVKQATLESTLADQLKYDSLTKVKSLAAEYNRILDEMPDTAERQAKLRDIISQINQILPEANLHLDENGKLTGNLALVTDKATGAIKLNVDALNEQTEAIRNGILAKYDAALSEKAAAEALLNYYQKQKDALEITLERQRAEANNPFLYNDTAAAINELNKKIGEQNSAYLEAGAKVEAFGIRLNSLKFTDLKAKLEDANKQLKSLGEGADEGARKNLEAQRAAVISELIQTEAQITGRKGTWGTIGAFLGAALGIGTKEGIAGQRSDVTRAVTQTEDQLKARKSAWETIGQLLGASWGQAVVEGIKGQAGAFQGVVAWIGKFLGHSLPEWYNAAAYKAIGSTWASDVAAGITEDQKIGWAVGGIKNKFDETTQYIHKSLDQLALDMVNWSGNTFSNMAKTEDDLLNKIKAQNELAHNQMFEYVQAKAAAMAQVSIDAINAIAQRWEIAAGTMTQKNIEAVNTVSLAWTGAANYAVTVSQDMADQVISIWDRALEIAIARGEAMEDYWNRWLAYHPEWTGGGAPPTPAPPTPPPGGGGPPPVAAQEGAYVTEPTLVLAGEKEPEWIVPQSKFNTILAKIRNLIIFLNQRVAERAWFHAPSIPAPPPPAPVIPPQPITPTGPYVSAPAPRMPSIPGLPTFATGGVFTRPALGLFAERGPEAVIPLPKLEAMTGKGAINIYVELDGRTIARAVGEPLVDEIRVRTGLKI